MCPHTSNPVLGISDRFSGECHSSPSRENSEKYLEMPAPCLLEGNKSMENPGGLGPDEIIFVSNSPSTPLLQSFANDPDSSLAGQQVEPGKSDLDSRLLTGTQMVDFADAELEWEVHNLCRARLDDNKQCIQEGVGCETSGGSGPLDFRGGRTTYQCTGVESGSVCSKDICSEYADCSCPLENGQQNGSCLYQEDGRDPVCRMLPVTQEREIMLSAEYLRGSLNTEADWPSRNF